MKKIDIWFLIQDGGDGSAYPKWYLTEKETEEAYDIECNLPYGQPFGETCNGRVETFEGSNIHRYALVNSAHLIVEKILKEEKNG